MGIYDQIHGECPHCGYFIGRKKGEHGYSGIQIKTWITENRHTTYDFYVGDSHSLYIDSDGMSRPPTFYERCYNSECRKMFKISFKITQMRDKRNVFEVILKEFEKY